MSLSAVHVVSGSRARNRPYEPKRKATLIPSIPSSPFRRACGIPTVFATIELTSPKRG